MDAACQEALAPVVNILTDHRDYSVIEFNLRTRPPSTVRQCVLWDPDRDRRIIAVATAAYFKDSQLLSTVAGFAEHGGKIDWWCTNELQVESTTRLLVRAARTLYADSWSVNQPQFVPVRADGLVDWGQSPAEHPLHKPAKAFQLGVMRKDGARCLVTP